VIRSSFSRRGDGVTAPPRREFARPNEGAIFSIFSFSVRFFCGRFKRLVFFLKLRE